MKTPRGPVRDVPLFEDNHLAPAQRQIPPNPKTGRPCTDYNDGWHHRSPLFKQKADPPPVLQEVRRALNVYTQFLNGQLLELNILLLTNLSYPRTEIKCAGIA